MPAYVKDGGVWKEATVYVRDGGVWKQATLSVKDAGAWKSVAPAVTFTPSGGATSGAPEGLSSYESYPTNASVVISCSQTATWTWSRSGSAAGTASVASGGSATSITFELPSDLFLNRTCTFTVSATAGGVTRYWTVVLTAESGT